jgi:hypothetical protein
MKTYTLIWIVVGALLSACTAKQVDVTGTYPPPLVDPLPLTLGVVYTDDFANHEFFDEAVGRNESTWLVRTGPAQVAFWNTLLGGMFTNVVLIDSPEALKKHKHSVDAVLIPAVQELQYTIPLHTNVKIYEIWMRYGFSLVSPDSIHTNGTGSLTHAPDDAIAQWSLTAYGKTPTAFLQSDEEAVNLAAVMALRDAGANFLTSFGRVPEILPWLDSELQQEQPREGPQS